jgi:hypothetical protein
LTCLGLVGYYQYVGSDRSRPVAQQASLFGPESGTVPEKPADGRPVRMRVLITVKAAPNPSATYGETVCVAGLRLDLDAAGWVRHYPINFREFDSDGKFRTAATWQRRSAGARQALAPPPNGSCVEVAQTSAGTIAVRDTTTGAARPSPSARPPGGRSPSPSQSVTESGSETSSGSDSVREARERVLQQWQRAELRRAIPPLLATWEPVVGQRATAWGIKRMKTKWGPATGRAGGSGSTLSWRRNRRRAWICRGA